MRISSAGQRLLDGALAAVGLAVASPVLVVAALAVKATSPGPVLHRATRVGRDGVPFVLFKFRSMRVDSSGVGVTRAGDARVTRVGRFLRGWKIDELPQLLNVLRGEMAVVGPRPEDPRYVAWYTPEQREVLRWRPGITSPASVRFRDEEALLAAIGGDVEDAYRRLMGDKIDVDLAYFRHRSALGDLRVIARTAAAIVGRRSPASAVADPPLG